MQRFIFLERNKTKNRHRRFFVCYWCGCGESVTDNFASQNFRDPDSATSLARLACVPPPSFDSPTAVFYNKIPAKQGFCVLHVRVERIELSSSAWKADILPLNYTRFSSDEQKNLIRKDLNNKTLQVTGEFCYIGPSNI
jgi:hypothetical protein